MFEDPMILYNKRPRPDTRETHEVRPPNGSHPSPCTKNRSELTPQWKISQVIGFPAQTDSEASLTTAAFHRPDHAAEAS
jgi:hypothetical protein